MLNGITLLSASEQVAYMTGWSWLGCLVFIAASLVTFFLAYKFTDTVDYINIVVGIIIVAASFFTAHCFSHGTAIPYTEYKVTIDETVGYLEFTEKYEVLNQDGEIYTIALKEELGEEYYGSS